MRQLYSQAAVLGNLSMPVLFATLGGVLLTQGTGGCIVGILLLSAALLEMKGLMFK